MDAFHKILEQKITPTSVHFQEKMIFMRLQKVTIWRKNYFYDTCNIS